ncbi:MAG: hypothetical protein WC635_09445 [Bacteriovorax sp.]|jgi:hypothetical protein
MKRKRILYNELNEDIYVPKYWTRAKLITVGTILLFFGFLFNFSLEEKLNKWMQSTLSTNDACPVIFEKIELSYFLPELIIKKPIILGACFGQVNNRLPLQNIRLSFHSPSFYPPGIKLHATIAAGKTLVNFYPVISPFSQYIEIEDTNIDAQIFAAMTSDNVSPVAGTINVNGFFKLASGTIEDGELTIKSNNFYLPAQNIKGFEMTLLNLKHLDIYAKFTDKQTMQISHIELGQPGMPLELKLKGNLLISPNAFINSQLQLAGTLHLSSYILVNFAFVKLFLPQENTSGTYQMKINGPLGNLGPPKFN